MPDLPDDHVHVATGAATRVVQEYGLATFLPAGFLTTLVQVILQAILTHQAGQQQVVAEEQPKGKKAKSDED